MVKFIVSVLFVFWVTLAFPATYTVNSTDDGNDGTCNGIHCSLREAINAANANIGVADDIVFAIPGAGPHTITLTTELPELIDMAGVTIDGFSQGGSANTVLPVNATAGNPLDADCRIIIGNNVGYTVAKGIKISGNNNIIKGLVLPDLGIATNNLSDNSIEITGNNNIIIGCYLGIGIDGSTTYSYTDVAIQITGANNSIGDGTAQGANLITGMHTGIGYAGILISGATATGNIIKGNMIGFEKDGETSGTRKQYYGIFITTNANNNTIGEGNVISGSTHTGVHMNGNANSNTVIGNIIGPMANGTTLVPGNTQTNGVQIITSYNNIIGGSTVGHRNIISANETNGIRIAGAASTGNTVKGNYLGLAGNGSAIASSSQDYGVLILNSASLNIIGSDSGVDDENPEGNTIAYNSLGGIFITGAATTGNLLSKNLIYSNSGNAIILDAGGNMGYVKPVVNSNFTATTITGTAAANDIVQVFKNSSGDCEDAFLFLGSTIADGSGNWSFAPRLAMDAGDTPVATARDVNNNTSELGCPEMVGLPITLLTFTAIPINNTHVQLDWQTASEINNDYFTIERSVDGVIYEVTGIVKGAMNSNNHIHYQKIDYPFYNTEYFINNHPVFYYRLKQTDIDGSYSYSMPVAVSFLCKKNKLLEFQLYPNPCNSNNINLNLYNNNPNEMYLTIKDVAGKKLYADKIIVSKKSTQLNLSGLISFLPGVYVITVSTDDEVVSKKMIVH